MNKHQYERARNVLKALIQGVHPTTGEDLPKNTIVNDIDINRALTTAITALDAVQARLLRRAQLPEGVGKTWSDEEEASLVKEFQGGTPVEAIAKEHKRTIRAIEARLELRGLMTAAQRTTNNSFAGAPPPKRGRK